MIYNYKFHKFIFYFLTFTWGILLTLAGLIVAGILLLAGKKPEKYGWCYYFEVGDDSWGGLELGFIFLVNKKPITGTLNHEFGHAIQNCILGPLMPFVICIPSAIRYWYREFRYWRKNIFPPTDYDAIWFEGEATKVGKMAIDYITSKY